MAKEMGIVEIEGMEFTLFYDYDELRDGKLYKLTDDGKVEWFRLRMKYVFLEPLRKIFNQDSATYRELNSNSTFFMTAAFSILLNGVEALGSFLMPPQTSKRNNFWSFFRNYMTDWNVNIEGETSYSTNCLPDILWYHFRNGIAHGYAIEGGGIEYLPTNKKWNVHERRLEVDPITFFKDFLTSVDRFFNDVKDPQKCKPSFLERLKKVYPCRKEVT